MLRNLALVISAVCLMPSCSQDELPIGDDPKYSVVNDMLPEEIVDVDLLFVIDNSGSMAEEQESLALWAHDALFGVLELDDDVLLNLHVAVVTTDMGAGPFGISSCEGTGDGGVFNDVPAQASCEAIDGRFLIDIDDGAGGRITNYSADTLSEAFGCIAGVGVSGCGFEQPLETMKRALDGSNPENAGFLREGALLAVIIVSDEDNCSVSDTNLFDPAQDSISDPLGPMSSFRCFDFGVVCDGDDPRTPGTKENCVPREDSAYLTPVQSYVDFLAALKADPSMVVVAAITGAAEPVEVVSSDDGNPQLANSCSSVMGQAYPSVRLRAFVESFPERNRFASICENSLEGPLSDAAFRIADTALRSPCLHGALVDSDAATPGVQVDCRVREVAGSTAVGEIRSCDATGGAKPCFTVDEAPATCGHTESGLAVAITRDDQPATRTVVECVRPQ